MRTKSFQCLLHVWYRKTYILSNIVGFTAKKCLICGKQNSNLHALLFSKYVRPRYCTKASTEQLKMLQCFGQSRIVVVREYARRANILPPLPHTIFHMIHNNHYISLGDSWSAKSHFPNHIAKQSRRA